MRKYLIILSTTPLLLIACGGGKKQVLEKKEEPVATVVVRDSLQESIVVYNAAKATAVPQSTKQPGIGAKGINANNPPIKLNVGGDNLEQKEMDLGDYFEKVSYVKIKHPLPKGKGAFLGNAECNIAYTGKNEFMNMWTKFNSDVFISDRQIVAGDNFFGYHVYDLTGKFTYTVAQPNVMPTYNNSVTQKINAIYGKGKITAGINSMNVLNNKALISIWEDSIFTIHIYDLEKQKGEVSLLMQANMFLIDSDEFICYSKGIHANMKPFMISLNTEGKVNKMFLSHNPSVEVKDNYRDPEPTHFYYYNNILTMRQAYNDTIYRMKTGDKLEAAYVLNMGTKKLEIKDDFTGSKEGKLIFDQWIETDKFIHMCFTENHDTPNNRKANAVRYIYFHYDKDTKKLYTKILKTYPEVYSIPNSLEGAIPTLANIAKTYKNKLYTSYTKNQLAEMMKEDKSLSFSESQKIKIKELHDSLDEQELLVMILE